MTKSVAAVERRTVLLAGGAVATTAALSGCIVEQQAAPSPAATQPATQPAQPSVSAPAEQGTTGPAPEQPGKPPLAKAAEIPAGGGVVLKDQKMVLTKDEGGKVSAFSAVCTHQGCLVTEVANGTINCPCHKSKFDAASGDPVGGPAKKPLPPVAVEERDGAIYQA